MKILVAGIGNIFMGDDGFGCEVARQLRAAALPADVDVVDFGIRGMDLGYALLDGYRAAILIDTARRGSAPGTVYVIEPDMHARDDAPPVPAVHGMDPVAVLQFVAAMGGRPPRLLLVACEPQSLGGEHGHIGLSAPVGAAVAPALREVRAILDRWLQGERAGGRQPGRSACAPGVSA